MVLPLWQARTPGRGPLRGGPLRFEGASGRLYAMSSRFPAAFSFRTHSLSALALILRGLLLRPART